MPSRFGGISANANTFIAPVLEGGTNGIVLSDGNGQGSLQIIGGSIEGVSATGLSFQNTFLPSSVTGVHFEANGQADIVINNSSNIRLSAIVSVSAASLAYNPNIISFTGDTRNVQITDSLISSIVVSASTKRIQLQNITFGLGGSYCPFANVNLPAVNPALPYGSIAYGPNNPFPGPIANITAMNIGNYCAGL